MTDMYGNPHYAPALADCASTGDGRAVAEALLALAHEQRTANLITWHAVACRYEDFPAMSRLAHAVEERLGLEDKKS